MVVGKDQLQRTPSTFRGAFIVSCDCHVTLAALVNEETRSVISVSGVVQAVC